MRTVLTFCAIALLVFCAGQANAENANGRVRAIYYEAARGVLVDRSMLRRLDAARWAEVELDANQRKVLVQVPADLEAGVGDRVGVQLAESKLDPLTQELPTLAVGRIVEVQSNPQLASPGR